MGRLSIRGILKLVGFTLSLFIVILSIAIAIYAPKIKEQAKELINSSFDGKFEFDDMTLSLLSHLPYLSITLHNYSLHTYENEERPVVSGEQFTLALNPLSALAKRIKIRAIYLNKPTILIYFDKYGNSNIDLFEESIEDDTAQSSFSKVIDFNRIRVKDGTILYDDQSNDLIVEADGVTFRGRGRYRENKISLRSRVVAERFSVSYQDIRYIDQKLFKLALRAGINLDPLKIELKPNRLQLSGVNASYNALVESHLNGYLLELQLNTHKGSLASLLSLLPSQYSEWLSSIEISGKSDIALALSNRESSFQDFSPTLNMSVKLTDGYIKERAFPHPINSINLLTNLTIPNFNFESMELVCDTLSFKIKDDISNLKFKVEGFETPNIAMSGRGAIDLSILSGALALPGFSTIGTLNYSLSVEGKLDPNQDLFPKGDIELDINEASISTPYSNYPLESGAASIAIRNSRGTREALHIEVDPIKFTFGGSPFFLKGSLSNFDKLNYVVIAEGVLPLDSLSTLFNITAPAMKGSLEGNIYLEGGASSVEADELVEEGRGELSLKNFQFQGSEMAYPLKVSNSTLRFNKERAILERMEVEYGENRAELRGYLSNFLNWALAKGTLKGALSVNSKKLNLDNFISYSTDVTTQSQEDKELESEEKLIAPQEIIDLPEKVNLSFSANVDELNLYKIKATNFVGEAAILNRTLFINGTGVNIAGANLLLDATYRPVDKRSALVDLWARADSFDIKRAYREIPILNDIFSSGAYMSGLISMDYKINTTLDSTMNPILPSMEGKGYIRLEDVNVKGLKVLGMLSKATGRDSIDNPNLKGVIINSTIADNKIKVSRTRMRIFGFRPRFEGESSFDGRVSFKFRLGLPPFGIIGIPVSITGSFENPIIKIKRDKNGGILYDNEPDEEPVKEPVKDPQ